MDLSEHKRKAKEKVKGLGPVKLILLIIFVAGTVCSYIFHDFFFENDLFSKVDADGNKKTGLLNSLLALVPRLITSIRIITIALLILTIVLVILSVTFKKGNRQVTVMRLISNIIRVITFVVIIIAVLAVWGIDTTALITGAGVLTLIVGLGMQSLISDVVAGLFIVFENEFNVGDIITVDGFRGTVVDIGIRTTKLEALGNIKIINNSDIKGVLNQTLKPSTALCTIDIEYGDSLPRVEAIIAEKLPEVKVEGVIDEIVYDGVTALGASGVTVRFSAKCLEGDIYSVQRKMNGEIKKMFDDNGIGIPFPQIVLHTAEDEKPVKPAKKPAEKSAKKPAAKKTTKTKK